MAHRADRRRKHSQRGARKPARRIAPLMAGASIACASLVGTHAAQAAPLPTVGGASDVHGGGWTVSAAGKVTAFGGAPTYGDVSSEQLAAPVVGMAATPDGAGYWLVASDGGVFSFGSAKFYGSEGNVRLAKPMVGIASTGDGRGYWLVAADGGVFTFGDARFYGSTGAEPLFKPVVGMASTPNGGGYWLVAADGGVFTFGDAHFYGSAGDLPLAKPVVGMAPTSDGAGYQLVAADGGVFTYGDARFVGSLGNSQLSSPVVALSVQSGGYDLIDATGEVTSMGNPVTVSSAPGSSSTATPPTTAPPTTAPPTTAPPTTTTTAAGSPPPVPGLPAGGVNFGGAYEQTFDSMPASQQSAVMQRVAAMGLKWIRVDVPFNSIEPNAGGFNWYIDPEVKLAHTYGINVDALIDYPPGWATLPDGSPSPSALAQFSTAAAQHLNAYGVHTFEIINEPNLGGNWGGTVNPAEYAAVLRSVYPAIKSVDPSSTVMTAGLSPATDASDGSSLSPLTFLSQVYAAGAGGYFDAVAIHPYSYPDMPLQADWWNTFYNVPSLYNLMVAHGDGNKKVWITEYGAPTAGANAVSQATQSTMVLDAFAAVKSWSWAGPIMLFDWQDDAGDGNFGLLNSDGTPKPAATALTSLLLGS
jgi:hypothetical protein